MSDSATIDVTSVGEEYVRRERVDRTRVYQGHDADLDISTPDEAILPDGRWLGTQEWSPTVDIKNPVTVELAGVLGPAKNKHFMWWDKYDASSPKTVNLPGGRSIIVKSWTVIDAVNEVIKARIVGLLCRPQPEATANG